MSQAARVSDQDWAELLEAAADAAGERGAELAVKLEVGTEYGWSCELRYTASPNVPDGPDESVVFFGAGGFEESISKCLDGLARVIGEAR